jgi:hypothetical protein
MAADLRLDPGLPSSFLFFLGGHYQQLAWRSGQSGIPLEIPGMPSYFPAQK